MSRVPDVSVVRRAVAELPLDADAAFDAIYPDWVRVASPRWWTPVRVARRAVDLLTRECPDGRYLDVGSGVGKFCFVGALASRAHFTGFECDARLHEVAVATSHMLGIGAGCALSHRDALEIDWVPFDGVYLFNPFDPPWAPGAVHRGRAAAVRATLARLRTLRRGARVVSYNGFGAAPPEGFVATARLQLHGAALEVWRSTGRIEGRGLTSRGRTSADR